VARSGSRSDTHRAVNRPRAIAIGAVGLVCLCIAWPQIKLMLSDSAAEKMAYVDASQIPWDSTPAPPSPDAPPAEGVPGMPGDILAAGERTGPEVHVTDMVEEEEPPPAKPVIETSADGDIALSMKLRWPQFEAGDRVLAKVKFTNHSLRTVYLPDAGEPDQGFAVVVEDGDGREVRRIVETAKGDQLPRRMAKIDSATEVEFPVTIVAEDETPLAPGTYTAYAELRPDPRLARLGLPLWTAPKGPIRSASVQLVVTAKAAK
jgi:hypothetical protein